jgi:FAD/FMN-containing dehydrogenase
MKDLRVTTLAGRETILPETTIATFQHSLRGQLIAPDDASYEEARQVWNANIDRRPGLICRPAAVSDVIQAVTFAREHHLLVSVRGGAHSMAGTCMCNGGLVIDLSLMKGIRVDSVRRTVRAEGGVKWGEFDHETQVFGLATTGGTVADTGIAGLTLGGGHGWLGNRYGLVSDNLISVDIVTADGQCRIASDTEHPDLFWAVRGGGGRTTTEPGLKHGAANDRCPPVRLQPVVRPQTCRPHGKACTGEFQIGADDACPRA